MLYQLSYSRLIISSKEVRNNSPMFMNLYGLNLFKVGRAGFEPTKAFASRFTVCPSWPLWYLPNINRVLLLRHTFTNLSRADEGIRTPDLQITNQLLWPTELHRRLKERPTFERNTLKNRFANVGINISNLKNYLKFFFRPVATLRAAFPSA